MRFGICVRGIVIVRMSNRPHRDTTGTVVVYALRAAPVLRQCGSYKPVYTSHYLFLYCIADLLPTYNFNYLFAMVSVQYYSIGICP